MIQKAQLHKTCLPASIKSSNPTATVPTATPVCRNIQQSAVTTPTLCSTLLPPSHWPPWAPASPPRPPPPAMGRRCGRGAAGAGRARPPAAPSPAAARSCSEEGERWRRTSSRGSPGGCMATARAPWLASTRSRGGRARTRTPWSCGRWARNRRFLPCDSLRWPVGSEPWSVAVFSPCAILVPKKPPFPPFPPHDLVFSASKWLRLLVQSPNCSLAVGGNDLGWLGSV